MQARIASLSAWIVATSKTGHLDRHITARCRNPVTRFHGSTGSMRLNRTIVGIAPTPNNRGYWLVASDGGVFSFNAPFHGSMGAVRLNKPVAGLVAFGTGYLMVANDGGVFDFSNKAFVGSLANNPPLAPIIGIAAT
jgi:hypothetical protein